jgi:hypothetical protein
MNSNEAAPYRKPFRAGDPIAAVSLEWLLDMQPMALVVSFPLNPNRVTETEDHISRLNT